MTGNAFASSAAADVNSLHAARRAQVITSELGDHALFASDQQVCKDTAFDLRGGGDCCLFGGRRKAAKDRVPNHLPHSRTDSFVVANTAINHLCPRYNYTWAPQ